MTDREKWIAEKTKKLIAEGYSAKQAAAIAYSMWKERGR